MTVRRTALEWMTLTRKFTDHPKLFSIWEGENRGQAAIEVRPGRPTRFNPAYSAWLEELAEELMHHRAEIQGHLDATPDNLEDPDDDK